MLVTDFSVKPARYPTTMTSLPIRPDIRGLEPYGAPQLDVPVVLNTNENPYSPPSVVVGKIAEAVARSAQSLNRYPDREFGELRKALAEYVHEESGVRVNPANVWAANGSNEVMLHLLQAFAGPGRSVVSFAPTYSMYPEYARDTFSTWIAGERTNDFGLDMDVVKRTLDEHRPAIVLLASPNNPTGTALPIDQAREIVEMARHTGPDDNTSSIVVIDEAYGEFRRDGVASALELTEDATHLVVTRTMSKAFGAAGLRLGYAVLSDEAAAAVRIVRLPYHLSATTQAAAIAALTHRRELMAQVAELRNSRDHVAERLGTLGLETAPSDANFVMFGRFEDRRQVWEQLLDEGVLIREVGPDGWLRVSIGTPAENERFLEALERVIRR